MRSYLGRAMGITVSVFGLAPAACDNGPAEPPRVTQCRVVCKQLNVCVEATDLMECNDRCSGQEFRSDLYYEAKANCVTGDDALSCDQWADELDYRGEDLCKGQSCNLAACVSRALDRQEPTPDQQAYCERLSNKLSACNPKLDAQVLIRACGHSVLELSQAYAEKTAGCIDKECSEIEYCLDDLADGYNTQLKVFSGDLDLN